jgi:hypothetical protein
MRDNLIAAVQCVNIDGSPADIIAAHFRHRDRMAREL